MAQFAGSFLNFIVVINCGFFSLVAIFIYIWPLRSALSAISTTSKLIEHSDTKNMDHKMDPIIVSVDILNGVL